MKNYILVILIIGIGLVSGCKKFLEENPRTQLPITQFYSSESEVESAVNALYGKGTGVNRIFVINGAFDGSVSFTLDKFAGMARDFVNQNPSIRPYMSLTQNADNQDNYLLDVWSGFYKTISDVNTLIASVEESQDLNTSSVSVLLGEARFFRAFSYYFLVRMFGDVPLVTESALDINNSEFEVNRTSSDSIYQLIISDLNWCINNSGMKDVPMGNNGDRVSLGAVKVLLAEAYLTMGGYPLQKGEEVYQKAFDVAKELVENGNYGLFQGIGNNTPFDQYRMKEFDEGEEYLFFLQYASGIDESGMATASLPTGFPRSVPKSDLHIAYSILASTWEPTENLLNLYDSTNDIRRHEGQYYWSKFDYIDEDGHSSSIDFPSILPRIWFDSVALFETARSDKYFSVYRMDDAYLIAAEAANETGVDPTPYLQPILNRAYVNPPIIPSGKDERRELILAERYRELAMEGHFWFDMIRTRLYPDADSNNEVSFSNFIGHDNGSGQSYQERDLLLPLPPSEMQRNSNLRPQNGGY